MRKGGKKNMDDLRFNSSLGIINGEEIQRRALGRCFNSSLGIINSPPSKSPYLLEHRFNSSLGIINFRKVKEDEQE